MVQGISLAEVTPLVGVRALRAVSIDINIESDRKHTVFATSEERLFLFFVGVSESLGASELDSGSDSLGSYSLGSDSLGSDSLGSDSSESDTSFDWCQRSYQYRDRWKTYFLRKSRFAFAFSLSSGLLCNLQCDPRFLRIFRFLWCHIGF